MPSVIATWSGQLTDRKSQVDLCTKVAELGEESHRLYREYFQKDIDAVWYDGLPYSGSVLVYENVFLNKLIPPGLEMIEEGFYQIHNVGFYGCQYVLFDPSQYNNALTRSKDRNFCFAFLHSDNPKLDGYLVKVLREDINEDGSKEIILYAPDLYFREYLEIWIIYFLRWVKHFYIPNLYYWIWEDLPFYNAYEGVDRNDIVYRDEVFRELLESFQHEAEITKIRNTEYLSTRGPEEDDDKYASIVISM
jgi:hypothetical protein